MAPSGIKGLKPRLFSAPKRKQVCSTNQEKEESNIKTKQHSHASENVEFMPVETVIEKLNEEDIILDMWNQRKCVLCHT